MLATETDIQFTSEQVDLCKTISARAVSEMETMRKSSEEAILNIGRLLGNIVNVATESNEKVSQALSRFVETDSDDPSDGEAKETIAETIERQSRLIDELVGTVKGCFDRQMALTRSASFASKQILQAAQETEELTARSKILSLNIHIEANRLGNEGAAFTVLSREIQDFSDDIAIANKTISKTIGAFTKDMPALEKETIEAGKLLVEFSSRFSNEMQEIRKETNDLTQTLTDTVAQAESYNQKIIRFSNSTLSCLQFQDPLTQGLQRTQFDLEKIDNVFAGKHVEDISLADIKSDVGEDGRSETDSGDVLLF